MVHQPVTDNYIPDILLWVLPLIIPLSTLIELFLSAALRQALTAKAGKHQKLPGCQSALAWLLTCCKAGLRQGQLSSNKRSCSWHRGPLWPAWQPLWQCGPIYLSWCYV